MLIHEQIDLPRAFDALFLPTAYALREFFALPPENRQLVEVTCALAPANYEADKPGANGEWVRTLAAELGHELNVRFLCECHTFAWVIRRVTELSSIQRRWLENITGRLNFGGLLNADAASATLLDTTTNDRGSPNEERVLNEALDNLQTDEYVAHGLRQVPLDQENLWNIAREALFELFIRLPHNRDLELQRLARASNEKYYDEVHDRVRAAMKVARISETTLAERMREITGNDSITVETIRQWLSPGYLSTDESRRLFAQALDVEVDSLTGSYSNVFSRGYAPALLQSRDGIADTASFRSEVELAAARAEHFRRGIAAARDRSNTAAEEEPRLLPSASPPDVDASEGTAPPTLAQAIAASRQLGCSLRELWLFV
ncbi:MAG: hypothetical protein KDD69_17190 [Bdellovibrionales bacterium]|nr:hypothetical protein [Bdellovibrionales bacterium]